MTSPKENLQLEEPLLEDSVVHRGDRVVDIKGAPTPGAKHRTGSWKACKFILVTECFEELAYYGIQFNLVTFLKTILQESNVSAARNYTNWQGTCYIAPLVGAIVADSYLGRYLTTLAFFAVYLIGMAAMSVSASFPAACTGLDCPQDVGSSPSSQSAVFFLGLYMMAIGAGGIKPCVSSFGADQFDDGVPAERLKKNSFFNWFFLLHLHRQLRLRRRRRVGAGPLRVGRRPLDPRPVHRAGHRELLAGLRLVQGAEASGKPAGKSFPGRRRGRAETECRSAA
ncbi:hypothetical protein ACQJBY_033445 [Aegilops geniculata]